MKLKHELTYRGPARKRQHGRDGVLYVHCWYSDEQGPHHGERLGWQELVFSDAESADKWLGVTVAAELSGSHPFHAEMHRGRAS